MKQTISAQRLILSSGVLENPLVEVEDRTVLRIRSRGAAEAGARAVTSFPNATLAPAYLDIHIHGAAGHDVMEGTPEALLAVENHLALHGVAAFLPTLVTSPADEMLRALDLLAGEIERDRSEDRAMNRAVPVGIHMEGPFLSVAKRGVHPEACLLEPSIPQFDRFWQAARGHIRLMTIAPELPHALDLIRHATGLGVRCSMGHSNALASEAAAGFDAGTCSATHTFNAMRTINQREPGIAGYVLDNDALYADIISDGFHVAPAMIRLFAKAKGWDRAILITDGLAATGMPAGKYKIGELEIEVVNDHCVSGGVIAGSILTLDRAVRNFLGFTKCGLPHAARLAARNPARMLGLGDQWGALEEGREANMVVLSPEGDLLQVFQAGKAVLPV